MEDNQTTGMKSGSRDKIEGAAKNLAGKIKESAGKALGNQELEARGNSEQVEGRTQKKIGEIKEVFDM
jgi:uncharacterized protein YjbJ (UPF0337 family)